MTFEDKVRYIKEVIFKEAGFDYDDSVYDAILAGFFTIPVNGSEDSSKVNYITPLFYHLATKTKPYYNRETVERIYEIYTTENANSNFKIVYLNKGSFIYLDSFLKEEEKEFNYVDLSIALNNENIYLNKFYYPKIEAIEDNLYNVIKEVVNKLLDINYYTKTSLK